MENTPENFSHIEGWGVDADPKNEPTYPMKIYTGDDHNRLNYERPPLQVADVEVLHSNERPNLTAAFGTSVPPSGLSGMVRRYAFRYSESSYGHWLPLLLADRINVIEGIIDDLKKGHIPNIFSEKGMKAELKHNPKGFAKRVIVGVIITMVIISRMKKKKRVSR
jgi:hypothetical protein